MASSRKSIEENIVRTERIARPSSRHILKRTKSSQGIRRPKYVSTENQCLWEKAEPTKSVEKIYSNEELLRDLTRKKNIKRVDKKLILKDVQRSFGQVMDMNSQRGEDNQERVSDDDEKFSAYQTTNHRGLKTLGVTKSVSQLKRGYLAKYRMAPKHETQDI